MKTKTYLVAVLIAASCALQAQPDKAAPEVKVATFPWLSHVVGSCWRSELTKGEVEDRQCFRAQFGRVVRVEQRIDTTDGSSRSTLNADSLYAWDPRMQKVRHIFWGSDGSFETSSGWIEGDALVFYLDRETGADGKAKFRTVLRKTGADRYLASREELDGKQWRQQFSFTYERDGAARE
jgi:hypothetical protein